MKDKKKIIIDGVDVSKCEFYCEEYCNLSNDRNERLPFAEKCTGYSDCCYKQLKRKEQEYEELREYHNKCCEEFKNEKQKLIDKYSQFSKDFFIGKYCKKEYCELLKVKEQECDELKKANDGILTTIRILAKNNIKLREILTEIKEIAEANIRIADLEGLSGVYRRGLAKQILQKAREV